VRVFAGNDDVSFADLNLGDERDFNRGPPHNIGRMGWPTMRYFNKETGIEGADYVKKTTTAICEELGDVKMMTEYVVDYAKTSIPVGEL